MWRVALDADVREIDPIDRAAGGLDGVAILGVDLLEGDQRGCWST